MQRISGIMNIISIGIMLKLLNFSLSSPEKFKIIKMVLTTLYFKIIVWGILILILYHLIAGIRHILMDLRLITESKLSGTRSAYIVLIITLIFSLVIGVLIW